MRKHEHADWGEKPPWKRGKNRDPRLTGVVTSRQISIASTVPEKGADTQPAARRTEMVPHVGKLGM